MWEEELRNPESMPPGAGRALCLEASPILR